MNENDIEARRADLGMSYYERMTQPMHLTWRDRRAVLMMIGRHIFSPDSLGQFGICGACDLGVLYVGEGEGPGGAEWDHAAPSGLNQSHIPYPL